MHLPARRRRGPRARAQGHRHGRRRGDGAARDGRCESFCVAIARVGEFVWSSKDAGPSPICGEGGAGSRFAAEPRAPPRERARRRHERRRARARARAAARALRAAVLPAPGDREGAGVDDLYAVDDDSWASDSEGSSDEERARRRARRRAPSAPAPLARLRAGRAQARRPHRPALGRARAPALGRLGDGDLDADELKSGPARLRHRPARARPRGRHAPLRRRGRGAASIRAARRAGGEMILPAPAARERRVPHAARRRLPRRGSRSRRCARASTRRVDPRVAAHTMAGARRDRAVCDADRGRGGATGSSRAPGVLRLLPRRAGAIASDAAFERMMRTTWGYHGGQGWANATGGGGWRARRTRPPRAARERALHPAPLPDADGAPAERRTWADGCEGAGRARPGGDRGPRRAAADERGSGGSPRRAPRQPPPPAKATQAAGAPRTARRRRRRRRDRPLVFPREERRRPEARRRAPGRRPHPTPVKRARRRRPAARSTPRHQLAAARGHGRGATPRVPERLALGW